MEIEDKIFTRMSRWFFTTLASFLLFACAGPALASNPYEALVYNPELLANGLKVIVHEDHELPVIYMEVLVRAGSANDPAEKDGLANFTAETITEGTESRSATEIAEAIDFVGGSLSSSAGYDATRISCKVLKKDYDVGLDVLSDVLLHPTFKGPEVERQRSQIITEIIGEQDRKATIADKNFQEILFGYTAYGHPVVGNKESVSAIDRDDILGFYRTYYRPNNSVMVIAGDVDRAKVMKSVEHALGGWNAATLPEFRQANVPQPNGYRIRLVNKPDVTQSEIRIGYPGIRRSDPNYFPLLLMNYILGGGGFSSRLVQTVRADRGLTYGIYSYFSARVLQGPFTVSTFTRTEKTIDAIKATLEEIDRMKEGGITQKELDAAKAKYIGGFPLGIETPSQVASKILDAELYNLGEDYLARYTDDIARVTLDDVNAAASRFLRSKDLAIVVVGNAEEIRDGLKTLGKVEEVFYTGTKGATTSGRKGDQSPSKR
jgi:zinc protease